MSTRQEMLAWETAAARLAAAAEDVLRSRPAAVIGITGPVGSGKSSLAARLSPCVVRTDDYLPDYEGVAYLERDEARHADLAKLASDLAGLRAGRGVRGPVWSFQSHRREGEREIAPASVVVVEGIHALEAVVAPHVDVRVYVESPMAVRWGRWEALERSGQRGWGVEAAREYFERVAEPTFGRGAARYRAAAHFVVVNPGSI